MNDEKAAVAETPKFLHLGRNVGNKFLGLETFQLEKGLAKTTEVVIETKELCSKCFVTSQPDVYMARVTVSSPLQVFLETKSVKKYFDTFRDQEIPAERLAQVIVTDFFNALEAGAGEDVTVSIKLTQNLRGGLELTTFAEIGY